MNVVKKIKRRSIRISRRFLLFRVGPFFRFFKKPSLPKNHDGSILIHIGCGEFNDSKYINVDTRPGWHIHYVDSIENCQTIFPQNYADLIYACHVLEHVSHLKLPQTLKGIYRCLKRGGILRLSVPDFETIVKIYQERNSIEDITPPLMGGQGYSGNFHYSVFNKNYLKKILLASGFKEVRKWDPERACRYNFNDWARKKINLYDKDWPISLNIEAIK